MVNIIDVIDSGGDTMLKNGWEYERLEMYGGAEPGLILGVYKQDGDDGYRLIAHNRYGYVVHADGKTPDQLAAGTGLALVPVKRTFKVQVQRIVTERAWVEVEAIDGDTAEEEAPEVAEDTKYDLDWDEYNTNYEVIGSAREA